MQVKPLSPLETRCYAALQAFHEKHSRLPSVRELTEAANFSGGSLTVDVLHRLVCKGWLGTDKLPAPERAPKIVKAMQPRLPTPSAPTFVHPTTREIIADALS